MPDPKIAEEKELRKKKKPDATDINIFSAVIKSLLIGLAFILAGEWMTFGTDSYWPFGIVVTIMGAAFPPIYLWIMIRLARQTEQQLPPRRLPN